MYRQVLVIEDDDDIAQLIKLQLSGPSCAVTLAGDGTGGLAEATSRFYDLIILDLMLPGIDGLEICRRMRGGDPYTPILMLTARASDIDRVLGLEIGADAYMTKPFCVQELVARVKAMFRLVDMLLGAASPTARGARPIQCRELTIDVEKREVQVGHRQIDLTAKEFELLLHFASNPGRVYSRPQLLDRLWGYNHNGYEHTVNSHINRLRAKIEKNPQQPEYIQTVWGVGYKFRTQPKKQEPDDAA